MSTKDILPPNCIVTADLGTSGRSPEQALALAAQYQAQGRLQESEALLMQVLQVQPGHPQALHLLGVIAHQVGKLELAVDLIAKAIAGNDNVALFHANRGEMCRQLGRLDEAIAHGERACALDQWMATAHSNLGIAHFDNKDYDRAEACQRRALELQPQLAPALNNLGSIMNKRERIDEAIDYYRRAAAANPDYLEPLNNLGAVLIRENRAEEAMTVIRQALQRNPQYADALCNMGCALNALERYEEAFPYLNQALQFRPKYAEAQLALGKVHQFRQDPAQAELAVLQAVSLDPDMAEAHSALGSVYAEMGEPERAEACFEKALALDPKLVSAILGRGNLHMEMGDLELAEPLFEQALQVSRHKLEPLFHLAQLRKVRPGNEHLGALEAMTAQAETMPETQQRILHYALGKSYDDLGNHAEAFSHFVEGGRLKRKQFNYDPAAHDRAFEEIAQICDAPTIERLRAGGVDSELPIFVFGMPRSGTTLTEQIIASHHEVYGAGELRDLPQILHRPTPAGDTFPSNLRSLTPELAGEWAADYLTALQQKAPEAHRITDKMPINFSVVGLIHAMLPGARLIHVQRNPVDTCLSCFTRLFSHGQEYTYDLAELGRYYVSYSRLMEHWRKVLPPGSFLEVRYEDIIEDPEGQTRRLLDYCGLPWDDACLEFHKTRRSVRTASIVQVRKPIYKSSVERWRSYEPFLGPLLDALGDLAPTGEQGIRNTSD